jgi:hypothetical protein
VQHLPGFFAVASYGFHNVQELWKDAIGDDFSDVGELVIVPLFARSNHVGFERLGF